MPNFNNTSTFCLLVQNHIAYFYYLIFSTSLNSVVNVCSALYDCRFYLTHSSGNRNHQPLLSFSLNYPERFVRGGLLN